MVCEAMLERVVRLGWRAVEVAAWRWAASEAAAGRTGTAFWVEVELVGRGVQGLELLWEVGTISDAELAAIVALADKRSGAVLPSRMVG